jgi:outer membrane cobalamin receptor
MTKEEKAKELFNKYYSYLKANLMNDEEAYEDAKQCALIAVDELIESTLRFSVQENNNKDYWKKIKQELFKNK